MSYEKKKNMAKPPLACVSSKAGLHVQFVCCVYIWNAYLASQKFAFILQLISPCGNLF